MAEAKRRRKSKAARKEESLRIRVSTGQKEILAAAAEKAGVSLSSWMLSVGLREATREGK